MGDELTIPPKQNWMVKEPNTDETKSDPTKQRIWQVMRVIIEIIGLFIILVLSITMALWERCTDTDDLPSYPFNSVVLVGGQEGNVFFQVPGSDTYSVVCDDNWTIQSGNVICKQLGYLRADKITKGSVYGKVRNSTDFSSVKCLGNEMSLAKCQIETSATCDSLKAAGVVCTNNTITNTTATTTALTVRTSTTKPKTVPTTSSNDQNEAVSTKTTQEVSYVKLKCHQCSTQNESLCADNFYTDDSRTILLTTSFLRYCPNDDIYITCKKTKITINGADQITRGCSTESITYSTCNNVNVSITGYSGVICLCTDEGCNGSSAVNVHFPLIVLLLIFLFAYWMNVNMSDINAGF